MLSSEEIKAKFPMGTKVTVTVLRKASFGVFVSVPGADIEGFFDCLHIYPYYPFDSICAGDELDAVVITLRDSALLIRRKILLTAYLEAFQRT